MAITKYVVQTLTRIDLSSTRQCPSDKVEDDHQLGLGMSTDVIETLFEPSLKICMFAEVQDALLDKFVRDCERTPMRPCSEHCDAPFQQLEPVQHPMTL